MHLCSCLLYTSRCVSETGKEAQIAGNGVRTAVLGSRNIVGILPVAHPCDSDTAHGIGAAFLLRSEEILEVIDESEVEFL